MYLNGTCTLCVLVEHLATLQRKRSFCFNVCMPRVQEATRFIAVSSNPFACKMLVKKFVIRKIAYRALMATDNPPFHKVAVK